MTQTQAIQQSCYRCGTEDPDAFGERHDLCTDCEQRIEQRKKPQRERVVKAPARPPMPVDMVSTDPVALRSEGIGPAATAPHPSLSNTADAMSASIEQLEGVIQTWVAGFAGVGAALFAIRDRKLYLDQGYKTFEAYCQERWGMERAHAYRLMEAAQIAEAVSPIGDIPNEGQARELARAYKAGGVEAATEVYREVREQYGDATTAKLIRQAVHERYEHDIEPQAEPTTTHALEEHLDTIAVEVIIRHRGAYNEARHTYERTEWVSGRFHLPADVQMPETLADVNALWHSIGTYGGKRMLQKPPITARWKSLNQEH